MEQGLSILAVAIALAALFKEWILDWWWRPKLDLSLSAEDYAAVDDTNGFPTFWLRLTVTNKSSHRSAVGVQVLPTRVQKIDHGSKDLQPIDTCNFIWSNQVEAPISLEIPPKVSRRIDVAELYVAVGSLGVPAAGDPGFRVALQVKPAPSAQRHLLPEGAYELALAVVASDLRSKPFTVTMKFDGRWPAANSPFSGLNLTDLALAK